jgi:membrane protein YqaA with SNARE-associated domain
LTRAQKRSKKTLEREIVRAAKVTPFFSGPRARLWLVVRFLLGLSALLALALVLVRTARPQLEQLGTWFVERFGAVGVGFGTLIADGCHFPIPPQFYMLLSIAAGAPASVTLAATTAGSLCGGVLGFNLSRHLGAKPKVARFIERISGRVGHKLGHEYAYRSVFFLSVTPMAFSVLCYLAGLYRMRRGPFALLLALRIPKLVLYYYLVKIGWSAP